MVRLVSNCVQGIVTLLCSVALSGCTAEDGPSTVFLEVTDVELIDSLISVKPNRDVARVRVILDNRGNEPVSLGFSNFTVLTVEHILVEASELSESFGRPCAEDLSAPAHTFHACNLVVELPGGDFPSVVIYDDQMGNQAEADVFAGGSQGGQGGAGAGAGGGGGGAADNVGACEDFLASIDCGGAGLGAAFDCSAYAGLSCDISDYFTCAADALSCMGGVLDPSGLATCAEKAVC